MLAGCSFEILRLNESRVGAAAREQFIVSALLNENTLRHHGDVVGFLDGGKLVSDGDGGSIGADIIQGSLHSQFGFGI